VFSPHIVIKFCPEPFDWFIDSLIGSGFYKTRFHDSWTEKPSGFEHETRIKSRQRRIISHRKAKG
jgi:hypothetical protein